MAYVTKKLSVTTAGSAERLATMIDSSLTSLLVKSFVIMVDSDDANTGAVWLGDSTVSASNGFPLREDKGNVGDAAFAQRAIVDKIELGDLYLDADTNGNSVRILYRT